MATEINFLKGAMNKQVIAGIIFMLIWVAVIVIWGGIKNIKPDYSNSPYNEDGNYECFNPPLCR